MVSEVVTGVGSQRRARVLFKMTDTSDEAWRVSGEVGRRCSVKTLGLTDGMAADAKQVRGGGGSWGKAGVQLVAGRWLTVGLRSWG